MIASKARKPVPFDRINSWRMRRQFLDEPYPSKNIVDLIKTIGWIYSPGCSTPYLALWARMSSFKAEDLNRLVFDEKKLVQLETLRGCTMLVPRDQAVVALRVRSRTFSELSKQARPQMPITDPELDRLKTDVLKALHSGPKTGEQLRRLVSVLLIRDFGPDLKRIGLTNSLSLSINLLREEGKVIKAQSNRRLDCTEYSFQLTANVLPEVDLFAFRMEEACARLAAQYFRAEAPARVKDFAWWSGINVTDAIRAAGEVKPRLVPVAVEGAKDEFLIPESEVDGFFSFNPQESPVNFIPYRDTFLKGQREIVDRFVSNAHADKPFSRWKGKLINDPLATIIRNGQAIGVWQWDEERDDVDVLLFEPTSKPIEKTVRKRASELATFIRNNLGEIRLQGLDIGPHQMTCIHQLKAFWGKGAQVDARV